jgi:hypothetical protein
VLHKRIVRPVIESLDEKRGAYFGRVVDQVETDPRTENYPNLPFIVLKETIEALPTYLEPPEMIEVLFDFIDNNLNELGKILHSPEYITDPNAMTVPCSGFILAVIKATMTTADLESRDIDGRSKYKLSWPIDPHDFPYSDD